MVVLACLTVTNQNRFRGSSHRVPSNKCRNSRDWWHRWWVQWEQPGNTWREAERWGQLWAKKQTDPAYICSDHFHGPSNSSSSFPPVSPEIFTHHNWLIFPSTYNNIKTETLHSSRDCLPECSNIWGRPWNRPALGYSSCT